MIVGLIRVLSGLLFRLSHAALQRLGAGLGWLLAHFIPVRKRDMLHALRKSFPEKSEAERKTIVRSVYRHLGVTAVECLAYMAPKARDFSTHATIEGLEHVRGCLAKGRGVILLMGHIGNWECLGRVLAASGHTPHVVVRGFRDKKFEAYWHEARRRLGINPILREQSYRSCVRRLAKNEMLIMVLDQNTRPRRGVFVTFFGRPACTTPGLAQLSARTQAPVVPVFMIRERDGHHRLRLLPPLPPPPDHTRETVRAATQHYTRILEDIIRAHPGQWLWGHRRWRTQPGAEAAPASVDSRKASSS